MVSTCQTTVVEPRRDVGMENVAPKRRRISPMKVKRNRLAPSPPKAFVENPATEALDRFLRMAVDDLPTFELQDEAHGLPFHPNLCAFDAPLKSLPTMHELTCGMARVSASS